MAKVILNGTVIAESDKVINDNGTLYFPHNALKNAYFEESETHLIDPQKGVSNFYHINCNGKLVKDAAYYFPNPNPKSRPLQNFVAFTNGVKIT